MRSGQNMFTRWNRTSAGTDWTLSQAALGPSTYLSPLGRTCVANVHLEFRPDWFQILGHCISLNTWWLDPAHIHNLQQVSPCLHDIEGPQHIDHMFKFWAEP